MQRTRPTGKSRLHDTFTAALDLLDAEHREPDRWEEECLSYALGAMACGMYLVAEVELAAFKRPVAERSPEVVAALAAKPARFTKAMLRHGLDYVQQRYGQRHAVDDVPPALAAGQRDFQSSLHRAALGLRFLFIVVEQQIGDEGIGLAFPAEGRGLAVAGHEGDVVAERP